MSVVFDDAWCHHHLCDVSHPFPGEFSLVALHDDIWLDVIGCAPYDVPSDLGRLTASTERLEDEVVPALDCCVPFVLELRSFRPAEVI